MLQHPLKITCIQFAGTGKTLSLICGTLAWLEDAYQVDRQTAAAAKDAETGVTSLRYRQTGVIGKQTSLQADLVLTIQAAEGLPGWMTSGLAAAQNSLEVTRPRQVKPKEDRQSTKRQVQKWCSVSTLPCAANRRSSAVIIEVAVISASDAPCSAGGNT